MRQPSEQPAWCWNSYFGAPDEVLNRPVFKLVPGTTKDEWRMRADAGNGAEARGRTVASR